MLDSSRIYLALENMSFEEAIRFTKQFGGRCRGVKIHSLYDLECGYAVRRLLKVGAKEVCVDAKIYDKPSAAADRAATIARSGAGIITVHASGGTKMMQAVMDRLGVYSSPMSIWAVTLLTSFGPAEIAQSCGKERTPQQIALDFALMAKEGGVNGVTCSCEEVGMLSRHPGLTGLQFITPGIRSIGADTGDQKRVGTPRQAIDDGADFIVVGSEVTKAPDPVAAFAAIEAELATHI